MTDTFLYGRAVGGIDPTVLDPLEVLDGALTNGEYDWPACETYRELSELVARADAARRRRRAFALRRLIVALGYLESAIEKQRSAMLPRA